jgi:hypothetical protein
MSKGETLAVPTGVTMRLVANGSKPRRALAVVVYDSSKPPTTRMPMEQASQLVTRRESLADSDLRSGSRAAAHLV